MLASVCREILPLYLQKNCRSIFFQLKLRVRTNFLPTFANKTNWQMVNRIVKSILCLTVAVSFMALADTNISSQADTESVIVK